MSDQPISEAAREAAEKIDEYCSPTHCGLTLEEHAAIIQRAIDRATAQAVAERDTLKKRLDAELLDWAETDTAVREAALRVLTPFEVNGDTHGVPCVTDIVDVLVKRVEGQREATGPLVEALEHIAAMAQRFDDTYYATTVVDALAAFQAALAERGEV